MTLRQLDSLFRDLRAAVTFIKCDVEGHEYEVFMGARNVVTKWKPACLIEISGDLDNKGTRSAKLLAMLTNEGYSAWWFDGRQLVERRHSDQAVNYFLLTAGHLRQLQGKITLKPALPFTRTALNPIENPA